MLERDENGRFTKGNAGGPGRPTKSKEEKYYLVTQRAVSLKDWRAVVKRAVDQAIQGDAQARKFLAEYLLGKPEQVLKHAGVENMPLLVEYVSDWRQASS